MATASSVARYIVKRFQEAGDPITNLKLQKLLYYVQGWHLAVYGAPAFNERMEAWIHGPVQPGVYGEYKHYRWNPITEEVTRPELDKELTDLCDEVLDAYGGDTGYQLEIRTHHEAPWIETRGDLAPDEESSTVISQDSMRVFFSKLSQGDGARQ